MPDQTRQFGHISVFITISSKTKLGGVVGDRLNSTETATTVVLAYIYAFTLAKHIRLVIFDLHSAQIAAWQFGCTVTELQRAVLLPLLS
jgi:hypothetical protein